MTNKTAKTTIMTSIIATMLLIGTISMTSAFADQPPSPAITLDYNPPSVVDGVVEMYGTVTVNGVGTSDANLQIQQGFKANILVPFDNPANSCADVITQWNDISGNLNHPGGVYTYSGFDTSGYGGQTLVFLTHISGSGGNFIAGASPCTPLSIVFSECEGDIQIAAKSSSSDPDQGLFGYTLEVKACTDVRNVKIQGGSNGWSTIIDIDANPDPDELNELKKNKNTVYSLKYNELSEDDEVTFKVNMESIKDISCGQTVQLNGAWSVAYQLIEDNTKYKTEYTSPITWTKECP